MINRVEFDNDDYILGITVDTLEELRIRRSGEELNNPHRVEFYALILVTEGSGFHYIDNKLYHCRPGTLFVLSPHQVHYFDSKFSWGGYVISFQDAEIFPIDNLDMNQTLTKAIRSLDVITEVLDLVGSEFRMLHEEYLSNSDIVSGRLQRNLLQNILYKVFFRTTYNKQSISKNKDLEEYQRFNDAVERYFHERHNVSDYVDELRTSVKRINTCCKKVKAVSAKKIIDSRILLEAKRMLGYTTTPISEIAIDLGFNEPTNLAKFFRRHTNISPTEFRSMSKFFSESER